MMIESSNHLLFKEEEFQIVVWAMDVLNTIGHGLLEKTPANALVVEFGLRDIPCKKKPRFLERMVL
ncbi:MAG: GxxExxY protein [Desulfobacteraceae bacterium]|nr:GxxExxY protein [Desulfobacteraceae bacterium]